MARQEIASSSSKSNVPASSGLHAFADNIWEPLARFRSERIFLAQSRFSSNQRTRPLFLTGYTGAVPQRI
jgi:hypothetical protein